MKNAWKIINEDERRIRIDVFICDNEGYENGNHDLLDDISISKSDLEFYSIHEIAKNYFSYDLEEEEVM